MNTIKLFYYLTVSYIAIVYVLFMYVLSYCMVLVGFIITNGPEDTTVCMNAIAEFYCGFTGTDPNFAIPNWRIVFRNDDGSTISNDIFNGEDILNRSIAKWSTMVA